VYLPRSSTPKVRFIPNLPIEILTLPRQDRTLLQILERIESMDRKLGNVGQLGERMTKIEDRLDIKPDLGSVRFHQPTNHTVGHAYNSSAEPSTTPETQQAHPAMNVPVYQSPGPQPNALVGYASQIRNVEEEEEDIADLSIPLKHATAAQKLLRWPSIGRLVQAVTHNEHYVIQAEERRGILRLFGRGEGSDDNDGVGRWPSIVSPPNNDGAGPSVLSPQPKVPESFDAPFSPFSESLWGTGLGPENIDLRKPREGNVEGLNSRGELQLDRPRMDRFLASYIEHIHVMHPFLDKDRLSQMFKRFHGKIEATTRLATQGRDGTAGGPLGPGMGAPGSTNGQPHQTAPKSRKRKRSSSVPPPKLDHSISTAIVLLVCALGAVCDHKEWIPAPAREIPRPNSPHNAPKTSTQDRNGNFTAPPSPLEASAIPPPLNEHYPRNVDVIPGLAYYAEASKILGTLIGGNELSHVQAYILAGLYFGQLGRVLDSWKWIFIACTSCTVLVMKDKLQPDQDPKHQVLLRYAFWTCAVLESDIRAELDLPPSGISTVEAQVPLPSHTTESDGHRHDHSIDLRFLHYLAQISMRRLLNRIHGNIYGEKHNGKVAQKGYSNNLGEELESQLDSWRSALPDPLRWNDHDPPPDDINHARLRAKYWGCRYIIYRPFVHHALHPDGVNTSFSVPNESPSMPNRNISSHGTPRQEHSSPQHYEYTRRYSMNSEPSMPPPVLSSALPHMDAKLEELCRRCIEAAIRSTEAFKNVIGRPIVTNIFGTAHA
jgi:hypothetical protein